jgi:hypothetical protein
MDTDLGKRFRLPGRRSLVGVLEQTGPSMSARRNRPTSHGRPSPATEDPRSAGSNGVTVVTTTGPEEKADVIESVLVDRVP